MKINERLLPQMLEIGGGDGGYDKPWISFDLHGGQLEIAMSEDDDGDQACTFSAEEVPDVLMAIENWIAQLKPSVKVADQLRAKLDAPHGADRIMASGA